MLSKKIFSLENIKNIQTALLYNKIYTNTDTIKREQILYSVINDLFNSIEYTASENETDVNKYNKKIIYEIIERIKSPHSLTNATPSTTPFQETVGEEKDTPIENIDELISNYSKQRDLDLNSYGNRPPITADYITPQQQPAPIVKTHFEIITNNLKKEIDLLKEKIERLEHHIFNKSSFHPHSSSSV
jgi:hypothetical protein